MEIRDPIHGTIELSDLEVAIIDTVEFQRLRAIKQLGFSEFSFPGATHNRYLHSIGVCHLAGQAFDHVFANFKFPSAHQRTWLRQTLRLAALLHDIGHGPMSHTAEEVMPQVQFLDVAKFKKPLCDDPTRQATHEDYTLKFLMDSEITKVIESYGHSARAVAALIDADTIFDPSLLKVNDCNLRPILSQIVSSEMDVDRMDYLERDAYFCGTNYGKVEMNWLIRNLAYLEIEGELYLSLNRRALYTFDDFLLARHHMHLMVYFHHKSIVYEEMLYRYLTSPECAYHLPPDISSYMTCTDGNLLQHLAAQSNSWARRVADRQPYRMVFELHSTHPSTRCADLVSLLQNEGIECIWASSSARLSKYHSGDSAAKSPPIFVIDQYDPDLAPYPIEQSTQIFQKYEEIRRIERIYVAPEHRQNARLLIGRKN